MVLSTISPVTINRLLSLLLLAVGTCTTALSSLSREKFHSLDGGGIYWPQPTDVVREHLKLVPDAVKYASYSAVLTAGIFSMGVGFVSLLTSFGWERTQRLPHIPSSYPDITEGFAYVLASGVVGLSGLVVSLVTFVFATVRFNNSDEWYYNGTDSPGQTLTFEAWTCQLEYPLRFTYGRDFGYMCRQLKAARYLIIPMMVASLIMVVSAGIRLVSGQKVFVENAKVEGVEMGVQK